MEQMPMWCPPTPPTTDNDVYIDYSLGFLYENIPMTEAQLPPIYIKKERNRNRIEIGIADDGCRPAKMVRHKEESVYAPRSLFDRPSPAIAKMRRDMKLHKYRALVRPPMPVVKTSSHVTKTSSESDQAIDWLVYEEWGLLHSIQNYQSLPLNTMILSPGHTPNWDMTSDSINNSSRLFRSPKYCRVRYESVIMPREEGKLLYDTTPKKQKKQKASVYKTLPISEQNKSNRAHINMRTLQLHFLDRNSSFTSTGGQRYEIIKTTSNKRKSTVKPTSIVNPIMRNSPSNADVLATDYKILIDNPLTPIDIATRRADRIKLEKLNKASQVLTPEQQQQVAARLLQHQQQQQQVVQQQQQLKLQQTQQQAGQQAIANSVASQIHQLAQATVTSAKVAATSVSLSNVTTTTATATTMVKARPGGGQMAMQDVRTTSANANIQQTAQRTATASLVSTGQTSAGVAGQKGSLVGVTMATAASGNKIPTPAQVQYYRQQQQQQVLLRQQQLKVLQAQAASGQKVSVAVSATAAAAAAQQRAALMKQGISSIGTAGVATPQTALGKPTVSRTLTDPEMAACLLKRQALQQQAKAAAAAAVAQGQVPTPTGLTPAQIFAQAGLQVQQAGTSAGGTPVATLVKTTNVAGVRTATPQQIRQLALHPQIITQRKLPAQKVAQLAQVANKAGVQTQLIVQPTKSLPATMTVQQIHQVMKHVQPSAMQQFSHVSTGQSVSQASQVVLAKSPLQTRVIPVAPAALKQTIQVVTASNPQLRQSTPIQGKPVAGTVRRSPGPGSGSSTGTSPGAAGASAGASPGVGIPSASASNLTSPSVLGQVRLQTLTQQVQQQQTQQQQQQTQQDAQPK